MKLLLSSTSGVDISAVTMTDVDNVGLDTDAGGTMTVAQHNVINSAAGTNQVTLTDTGTFTANADVETYVLKASGGTTITLSAAGQNVTTGADGADTINVAGLTATGTFNTVAADIIKIDDGGSIAGVTETGGSAGGALDATNLTLVNGASVSMTAAQHNGFSGTVTAAGTEQITLTTAGTVTGESVIETYVLSGTGNVFTLGAAAQSVNTGTGGSNTVDVSTLTATGTFTTQTTDTVKLGDGSSIAGATKSGGSAGDAFTATNLTLASGASVSMTAAQNTGFGGTVTAAGTEQITLTTTGTTTALSAVETYVLKASGGTTITLSAAGQNVTTGADGADTINVAGLTATGTFNTVAADIIKIDDGGSIAGVTETGGSAGGALDATNLTLVNGASVSMTAAQHNGFSGTVTAAGTEQITLTTAGTVTGESVIATYVLSGTGNVFTMGAAAQSVNTGTGGSNTVDVSTLTATGTFTTQTTDTVKLGNGANIAGATKSEAQLEMRSRQRT